MLARFAVATLLALSLFLLQAAGPLGDGGERIAVQPLALAPGGAITVKGSRFGAYRTVEVCVSSAGVDVDLGVVAADGRGSFTAQFLLPADLPLGIYRVQAKGEESATAQLIVLGRP